jgi:chromosome segregation and condensation protein ScpB
VSEAVPKLSPRQARALAALLRCPEVTREQLDSIAGSSNSPAVVARLRLKGLLIDCEAQRGTDRDGRPCWPGVYRLRPESHAKAKAWLAVPLTA